MRETHSNSYVLPSITHVNKMKPRSNGQSTGYTETKIHHLMDTIRGGHDWGNYQTKTSVFPSKCEKLANKEFSDVETKLLMHHVMIMMLSDSENLCNNVPVLQCGRFEHYGVFCGCFASFYLRQCLILYPWLTCNSRCRPDFLRFTDPPTFPPEL